MLIQSIKFISSIVMKWELMKENLLIGSTCVVREILPVNTAASMLPGNEEMQEERGRYDMQQRSPDKIEKSR